MKTERGHGLNRAWQSQMQTKTDSQKIAKGAKLDALTLANFAPFCSEQFVTRTTIGKFLARGVDAGIRAASCGGRKWTPTALRLCLL